MTQQTFDVVIVGASFGGLACATHLAEHGKSVCILELKKDITKGIHTTGIIVKEAAAAFDLAPDLTHEINQVRLYAPSLKYIDLHTDDYFFQATDTPNLMAHLKTKAENTGVTILMNSPYKHAEKRGNDIFIHDYNLTCQFLIGADGPQSKVAQDWNLGTNQKYLLGAEAEFSTAHLESTKAFYCFLNQKIAYGYLGWVVPNIDIIQVGLATSLPKKPDIGTFIDHIAPLFNLDKKNIVSRRGGLIPCGGPVKPLNTSNVLLLGDAAGTVSPLSAGGIHTAHFYGLNLAKEIISYSADNTAPHPSKYMVKHYPKFQQKRFKRWVFEHLAPDWLLNITIGNPLFKALAKIVFFKEKKLS